MKALRFTRFAWVVLAYNIAVILWGAFVRASNSGDGCGNHWPSCHGVVVPQSPTMATLIELAHRATSGLALLLVVAMLVWSWRLFERGHGARRAAGAAMALMISESLIGAGLVLFRLVADDTSAARAVIIAAHLVNTFLLLGAIVLAAWWAPGRPLPRLRGQGGLTPLLAGGLLGIMLLGSSGALNALGDTLFPATSLAHGLAQDMAPDAHFLIKLRFIHPLLAGCLGLYILLLAARVARMRPDPTTRTLAQTLVGLFVLQGSVGALNLVLLAPAPMQVLHLLMADVVWIILVLLSASALAAPVPAALQLRQRRSHALARPLKRRAGVCEARLRGLLRPRRRA